MHRTLIWTCNSCHFDTVSKASDWTFILAWTRDYDCYAHKLASQWLFNNLFGNTEHKLWGTQATDVSNMPWDWICVMSGDAREMCPSHLTSWTICGRPSNNYNVQYLRIKHDFIHQEMENSVSVYQQDKKICSFWCSITPDYGHFFYRILTLWNL